MADRRDTQIDATLAQVQAQDLVTQLAAGSVVEIWAGPRPADNATAPGVGTTLLGTKALANPAGVAAGGVVTFTAPGSITCLADGVAAWYRVKRPDASVALSGSCGVPGLAPDGVTVEAGSRYNMEFNSVRFVKDAEAVILAWTHTVSLRTLA